MIMRHKKNSAVAAFAASIAVISLAALVLLNEARASQPDLKDPENPNPHDQKSLDAITDKKHMISQMLNVPLNFFVFPNAPEMNRGKAGNLSESTQVDVTDILKQRGITFTQMARATYYPKQQLINVVNTEEQVKLVQALLKAAGGPGFQIWPVEN